MSIESVMPSNYLILCRPLLLLPSIFPSIRVFANESAFFFFNFLSIIIFFLLYNIVLVLPYINMHLPQVYTCSPSWTPPSTSLPVPSLWVIPVHQPQASCILHRTWTGDSFLIWYCTCFNAILPNHPTPPSTTESKRLLYTSGSLAVSHTGLSLAFCIR